ncbi:MAG: hypothetical protein ABJA81_04375 [Nocardioidaceae bacterium]
MSAMIGTLNARRVRVLSTVAVIAAAAVIVAGISMTAGLLSTGGLTRPGPLGGLEMRSSTHKIGDDVKTSFGIVAVECVRSLDGLSSRSLAGATHGVPGFVDAQHAQVQAALAVTNRNATPLLFRVDQVRLRVVIGDHTSLLRPVSGDMPDTRVLTDAGIGGHLDFVVPRKGAHLTLLFDDPGSRDPVLIDLGKTDYAPAGSGHDHAH